MAFGDTVTPPHPPGNDLLEMYFSSRLVLEFIAEYVCCREDIYDVFFINPPPLKDPFRDSCYMGLRLVELNSRFWRRGKCAGELHSSGNASMYNII